MKILVAINTYAGGKRAGKMLPLLKELFSKKSIDIEILESLKPRYFTECLASKDLSSYQGIAAAGGDGTLFDVVNGYMLNPQTEKPPIAILPVGTGNSFALEMGFQKNNLEEAIEIISQNSICMVDLGFCNSASASFYFANILGTGFVGDVNEIAQKIKFTGSMAYNFSVLYRILLLKHQQIEITIDEKLIKQSNLMIEISNTKYTGGNYLMAPHANFSDGLLDIIIARKMPRHRLLNLFGKIFKGEHINSKDITYIHGKNIRITSNKNNVLSPDGELYGNLPAEISCLPKILPIFCPENMIK